MSAPLRVLFSSTSFPRDAEDWRGRFIADMAQALVAQEGVALACWMPPGMALPGADGATTAAERQWLDELACAGGMAHLLRTRPLLGMHRAAGLLRRLYAAYRRRDWDVAHVNWLQNALPLPKGKPAVITVLGSDYGLLRLPGMVAMLRAVLRGRRAWLAPNAPWMVPLLQRHFGDLATVQAIPFGVHARWFAVNRTESESSPPWLVVTRVTQAKLGYLLDWGAGLFGKHRPLVLFGPMQEPISLPDWVDYRGPTHPVALAETWFPQAAGLLTLSRHDEGRPQVLLDAMAAGLPVIASDLPAHRDLLRHGETGWLVASAAELAHALDHLAEPAHRQQLGLAARAWIGQEIGDWSACAGRYLRAYRHVLAEDAP